MRYGYLIAGAVGAGVLWYLYSETRRPPPVKKSNFEVLWDELQAGDISSLLGNAQNAEGAATQWTSIVKQLGSELGTLGVGLPSSSSSSGQSAEFTKLYGA